MYRVFKVEKQAQLRKAVWPYTQPDYPTNILIDPHNTRTGITAGSTEDQRRKGYKVQQQ
jgi:hypothetical protein